MNKMLVILGPTATGKTGLGLKLARKLKGEILSADSRQVYRGMDVITGKDLPVGSRYYESKIRYNGKKVGYWKTSDGAKIWLLDLADPKEEFSVAQWHQAAQKVLSRLWKQKKLPILVGGTGLYIKAVVDGIETINVPPNRKLRASLAKKGAEELYAILSSLDPVRAGGMNRSDRKNPRRLIRAIEIAYWRTEERGQKTEKENRREKVDRDVVMLGLSAPRKVLYSRIDKRVEKRLKEGALQEIEQLLRRGVAWDAQAMQGLGYRQLRDYFEKKVSLQEAVQAWKNAEHQYARQQLTWFRREKRIRWFDITKKGWRKDIEKLVGNWYDRKIKHQK